MKGNDAIAMTLWGLVLLVIDQAIRVIALPETRRTVIRIRFMRSGLLFACVLFESGGIYYHGPKMHKGLVWFVIQAKNL